MRELADFLKSERLGRGIPLDSISRDTGMSLSALQALEAADWDKLNSSLMVRSFVRAYCSAIGIDSSALLEKYSADILACDRQQEYIVRFGKWAKSWRVKRRLGPFGLLLFGIGLAGIVSGGIWLSEKRAREGEARPMAKAIYSHQEFPPDLPARTGAASKPEPAQPARVAEVKVAGVVGAAAPAASEPAVTSESEEKAAVGTLRTAQASDLPTEVLAAGKLAIPSETTKKHLFAVDADEKTWIQVEIDNKMTQSVMLYPGDKREWEAETGMRIVVGNLGGVRMQWDGQPVDAPGKPGRVLRFRLPDPQYVKEQ